MKKIKNQIKLIAAAALVGASVSSCSLDLLPLNEVVLENYWKEKADVESVVASCYSGMMENGYVRSMIVWGEDRSDNITSGPDAPTALTNLMKGRLKTTNEYCDWSAMYNVINRCNTVIHYAPEVAETDPNYTTSEMKINLAECKALRALSYFTLIKTFKDVPFTLSPSIDDNQEYRLRQVPFEVVLDSLIGDIEACKSDVPRRYSEAVDNTAKITQAAMYSLLAEMYLWRASDYQLSLAQQNEYYRKCIEACDWVLNFKIAQYNALGYRDRYNETIDLTKQIDAKVWANYGYPLLAEGGTSVSPAAASDAIFGDGNSYESIFEITYNGPTSQTTNEDVGFMYGGTNSSSQEVRWVRADEHLMSVAPKSTTFDPAGLFSVSTDYRTLVPFRYTENGSFDIHKYSVRSVNVTYTGTGTIKYDGLREQSIRSYSVMYPNWIIYRMSEIMLFRAEAEIELAGNMTKQAAAEEEEADEEGSEDETPEGDTPEGDTESTGAKLRKAGSVALDGAGLMTAEELYDDAFNLICAIYVRSNPASETTSAAKPSREKFTTLADFEKLLMNERRRELLFEGKRYFDLVRQARREGNTNKFVTALTSKYGEGGAAVAVKMKQMDFMYMPILKKQIQVNPNLQQNSAYLDEEQLIKN